MFISKLKKKGDYVWLDPKERGDFDVAIGACVKNSNSSQVQVVDDEGKVLIELIC